jgi:hypothetical protein
LETQHICVQQPRYIKAADIQSRLMMAERASQGLILRRTVTYRQHARVLVHLPFDSTQRALPSSHWLREGPAGASRLGKCSSRSQFNPMRTILLTWLVVAGSLFAGGAIQTATASECTDKHQLCASTVNICDADWSTLCPSTCKLCVAPSSTTGNDATATTTTLSEVQGCTIDEAKVR